FGDQRTRAERGFGMRVRREHDRKAGGDERGPEGANRKRNLHPGVPSFSQRARSATSSGNISPISSCSSRPLRPITQTIGSPFGRPSVASHFASSIAA